MGIVRPRLKHTNLTTCATQEGLFPQDGRQIVHHPFGHAQLTLHHDSNTIYCVCKPEYFYILCMRYAAIKNLVYENCRLASAKTIKRQLGRPSPKRTVYSANCVQTWQRVQCEYSLAHRQEPVPAVSAEGAQRINQRFLYTTIYCICQDYLFYILEIAALETQAI